MCLNALNVWLVTLGMEVINEAFLSIGYQLFSEGGSDDQSKWGGYFIRKKLI